MEDPKNKTKIFLYTPFTGLGLKNGFRGNNWLKNRIQIFKQFVIPSYLAQTNRDFTHWISWRREERNNFYVKEVEQWLKKISNYKFIFTYSGLCFFDDKFSDEEARDKLITNLHGTIGELLDTIGECDYILMVLAPSDDCWHKDAVKFIQNVLKDRKIDACGYSKGYIMNYQTKEIKNYNPLTNPPFYTIKFPRDIFIDPLKHINFTGIKYNFYNKKYPLGTPLPSHEYLKDVFGNRYAKIKKRGFIVGTHGENISTTFNIPYAGEKVNQEVLKDFGLENVKLLKIKYSLRKKILRLLPHSIQRKLRYIWGECIYKKLFKC